MSKSLTIAVGLSLTLVACNKLKPNAIRSGSTTPEVAAMLDKDSLRFTRAADGRSGILTFDLKDQHNCRIEYAADDPSGSPQPASPLAIDCPKDKLSLTQNISITGLTKGFPVTFHIYVWPKTVTLLSHFVQEFHEPTGYVEGTAQNLVIVRYQAPRGSAEIYGYRSSETLSIKDLGSKIGLDTAVTCTLNPGPQAVTFERAKSQDDPQKRPLFGLSDVKTDGYGTAAAKVHPFFPTRLLAFYDATSKLENWKWSFTWENQPYSFDSNPPGMMSAVAVGDGKTSVNMNNRNLQGALPDFDLTTASFQIAPKVLYPAPVSHFELDIKSQDAAATLLTCRFPIDKGNLVVPSEYLAKLPQGSYLATFSFETNQIHYRDQGGYPPWIITAQDWVEFRLNKRL